MSEQKQLPDQPELKLGIYEHYSGKRYEIMELALHSELLTWHVVYRPLYETKYKQWIRPFDMFTEEVTIAGKVMPRFRFISPVDN